MLTYYCVLHQGASMGRDKAHMEGSPEDFYAANLMRRIALENFDHDLAWILFKMSCRYAQTLQLHQLDRPDVAGSPAASIGKPILDKDRAGLWDLIQTDLLYRLVFDKPPTLTGDMDAWKVNLPTLVSQEDTMEDRTAAIQFILRSRLTFALSDYFHIMELRKSNNDHQLISQVEAICVQIKDLYDEWNIDKWVQELTTNSPLLWNVSSIAFTGYHCIIYMLRRTIASVHKFPTLDQADDLVSNIPLVQTVSRRMLEVACTLFKMDPRLDIFSGTLAEISASYRKASNWLAMPPFRSPVMQLLVALALSVVPAVSRNAPPLSWKPPVYPATTRENDGTLTNRFDVRDTLAYVTNRTGNVNNVFTLLWVTTTEGKKFHLTTNAGLIQSETMGTFISLNDLQDRTARGASTLLPGSGNPDRLDMRSVAQNITGPAGGDGWTNTQLRIDLADIGVDVSFRPTGKNFYYGGNGGVQLFENGPDEDVSRSLPGWSWYWANPTTRINGTLSIDGKKHTVDSSQSYALFERQWGDFNIGQGYYILWLYLETGEVLISWSMEPNEAGESKIAFASIWHPNGWHEMIPVGPKSRAWDISKGKVTGYKYFNRFFLDLPARDASFRFDKWVRDAELVPSPPEQLHRYINISESYGAGTARWNGKTVKLQGHVEQLSRLR
ncbi:hypothetical protein CDV31_014220 [Fusarium ambrosium]|uniref:Uncharacterized protein n=1 Tax=Fusarium ambrosium TaxID=131363 RepID=A0A428SY08_9HYPO|nr:hypothetical protein CDV31_014220 [Fusarium ambrosium]